MPFPTVCPNVNVIVKLEFKLVYLMLQFSKVYFPQRYMISGIPLNTKNSLTDLFGQWMGPK